MKKTIKLPKPSGYYDNYIKCVYGDPDYLVEMQVLRELIKEYEGNNPNCIYVGTELTSPENIKGFIHKLMEDFDISWDTVDTFLTYPDNTPISSKGISVGIDDLGNLNIDMTPGLTRDEFIGFWPMIESVNKVAMGNVLHKSRGFDFPKIAYEIYRERKRKVKFSETTSSLRKRGLSYSEDDVKRMFYKLKKVIDNHTE